MSDTYSNCYLTISAMSYENNTRGFRSILPEDVPPHQLLCQLPDHPDTEVWVRSMIDHKYRRDYLKHRAWAFQELLLSPRVLHLTSTAMAFECDTCTTLERGSGSDVLFGIDVDRKRLVHAASYDASNDRTRMYDSWLQLVQSYSRLELTYTTDRLPALSGIAHLVATKANDTYVAGLWKDDIAAGLLWYVWPCQPEPTAPTYIAPSWSWASTAGVWTLEPARRRFLNVQVIDVHAQCSTSNPYGEVSSASLTICGPMKRVATRQLLKKGRRYFTLKGEIHITVRFALDSGQLKSVKAQHLWCLDCTADKVEDIAIAHVTPRRDTFFRPHGIVLEWVKDEHVYKRVGAYELFDITEQDTDWHKSGFVAMTVEII